MSRAASTRWSASTRSLRVSRKSYTESKSCVLQRARRTYRGNASFCASSGEGMNLLSSLLGSKYPVLSPVKLVGIRPQDLVDILQILWFLFCQDAHYFCEAREEGKGRNIQSSLQNHLWKHLWFHPLCINLRAWSWGGWIIGCCLIVYLTENNLLFLMITCILKMEFNKAGFLFKENNCSFENMTLTKYFTT